MQAKAKVNKNNFSVVYSEFSRQQFNKYKLKFPKLKESEITKKVWKEWEDMDEVAKEALLDTYRKKGIITDDSKPKKSESKESKEPRSKSKKKEASPAKQVALPAAKPLITAPSKQSGMGMSLIAQPATSEIENSSDVTPDILKQRKPGSESGRDGSLGSSDVAFKKKVQKRNYGEYTQFFRFYFERLTKEHPKWTPNQKTVIIRLLWKKRQLQKKKEASRLKKDSRLGVRNRVLI